MHITLIYFNAQHYNLKHMGSQSFYDQQKQFSCLSVNTNFMDSTGTFAHELVLRSPSLNAYITII